MKAPQNTMIIPSSSMKSIMYSWSRRGTHEQCQLNDAMASIEQGREEAKAPRHASCTALTLGISFKTTPALWPTWLSDYHKVLFNGKTQKIPRWVKEALRCYIIKLVKVNFGLPSMVFLCDWEELQELTAGGPKTISSGQSQDFPGTQDSGAYVSSCFLSPVEMASWPISHPAPSSLKS